jgi:copper(I)-binding protein
VGDSVRLRPGGRHVMLEGLRRPLAAGDSLRAVLRFRRAGALAITAPVVAYQDLEQYLGPTGGTPTSTGR